MAENKERLVTTSEEKTGERGSELQDISTETTVRIPPEVRTWMRKVEEDPGQMKVVNDASGQPLLQTTAPQKPKVRLPVTKTVFIAGFKKAISETGKWLSTFLLRLIKLNEGQVEFKPKE